MDLEEQYDKIYRYCYAKVQQRELAEDLTQETFLRFFANNNYRNMGKSLHYLYTIARNLCIDEYRKQKVVPLEDDLADENAQETLETQTYVRIALSELSEEDRELLLLRYVNDVPISVIGKIFDISRFAAYRKIMQATKHFEQKLGKEESI